MFDAFREPHPAERLRAAAVAPIAAFLIAQFYFSLYPMLRAVPAWLFWLVVLIVFAGTAWGLVASARIAVRQRRELDWRGIAWLVIAVVASLFCGRLFLALTFPWL
ncbi:MAG TPA: hypothetical protein VGF69_23115 [Thermoanaerobaculia bacterium]|jgi:hypothetical protein